MPNAQCPIPNAQCPMPNAQFPMPNSQCPIPNAQFPMPNSQCPMPNSQFPIRNSQFFKWVVELVEFLVSVCRSTLADRQELQLSREAILTGGLRLKMEPIAKVDRPLISAE